METRFDQFLQRLHSHATLIAIEDEGGSHSYAELLAQVAQWRARLAQWQIVPGSVVGLRADYSVAAVAALIALFSLRAVAVLIPRDRDVTDCLRDARATAALEFAADGSHRWLTFTDPQQPHPLLETLRQRHEGGVVIFTSGSTGRPKAALQSVERFLHKFRKPGRRLRTMAFLLFDHVAGLDTLFYTLANGGTLIVTRRRDPRSICELIESQRVEVLPSSPSFLRLLCSSGASANHDLSSLQVITYGSEPMDASTLARLNACFPSVQISQKYGTTETGSPRSVSRGNDSLWLKIKSDTVETKVVEGILWIRSEGTILGYLNAPSPVDGEGWYCTGDLVEVDGEWLRFLGRSSDVINVGGEKVAPAEVEQTLLELDFIGNVVVSGQPHPLLGQIVTARVAICDQRVTAKEAARRIRMHCRQRLASYKVPVKIDIATAALTNDRQKAQRRVQE